MKWLDRRYIGIYCSGLTVTGSVAIQMGLELFHLDASELGVGERKA